jgi:broad specificity phosphatase PhoE
MLYVVRHGRTTANASGVLLGRADPPLDDVGELQATAIAASLPISAGAVIVSSPLQRARQTATAIADRHGISMSVDDRWIELDYGTLDGTALADVPADVWTRWQADPSLAPGGGESLLELRQRVVAACNDVAPLASERDVVVVTHVSPIKAAVAWALASDDELSWRLFVAPASITTIAVRGNGRAALHGFNAVAHL